MKTSSKTWVGCVTCGAVVTALALGVAPAGADDMTGTKGADTAGMAQPTQVTGNVSRLYYDRSGYVTAADVQTANGSQMVHFAPGWGTRFQGWNGQQATVWVVPNAMGAGHWDVVSLNGTTMMHYTASDIDLLQAVPYIMAGAQRTKVEGKLDNVVVNDRGEVLALVLRDSMMGGMAGPVLVRVPADMRHGGSGTWGNPRVADLKRGSDVSATGLPEAALYGVVSSYPGRLIADTINVDGRSVGVLGFPRLSERRRSGLFGGSSMMMYEKAK